MEPTIVQKLLPELKKASSMFEDVTFRCLNPATDSYETCPYKVNSLIVAAASPMLARAMLGVQSDEEVTILVTEGGISNRDLEIFFTSVFNWNVGEIVESQNFESVKKILDLLSIKFDHAAHDVIDEVFHTTTFLQSDVSAKSFKCDDCDASFRSLKLRKRHARTAHSESHPHVCRICGRRCRGPAELSIHERCHSKEKPFSCDCGKSFAQKSQLNDHLNKVHVTKNISSNDCRICGKRFATEKAIQRHVKIHAKSKQDSNPALNREKKENFSDDVAAAENRIPTSIDSKKVSCPTCGRSFSQQSHLNVHIKILHEGAKPFMCSFCGRQFAIKSNLKKHLKMHERKRAEEMEDEGDGIEFKTTSLPFEIDLKSVVAIEPQTSASNDFSRNCVCEFCGRAFHSDDELRSHSRTHQKRPFVCDVCQETFETWSAKKIHQKEHTGAEQFVCATCNLACVSKSALAKHQLIHTGDRPHACQVDNCRKKFVQKSQLNYHLKIVHGPPSVSQNRSHHCQKCEASFSTSSTLRKHERIHSDDRRHECDKCGKRFIQKTHFMTHILRHTGERPFSCDVCSKSFITSSNLTEHMKSHTGTKKVFRCNEQGCDAKYTSAFDLKVHTRKHTGETPFLCIYCNRAFRSKRLLADHSRSHTGEIPFFCSNCSKTFVTSSGLKQHFRRHEKCRLAATSGDFSMNPTGLSMDQTKTGHLMLPESETALLADSILATQIDQADV